MLMLGESNVVGWVAIAMGAISTAVSTMASIVLQRVQRNQQKQDDERVSHARRVTAMEASLEKAANTQHLLIEKLVDERFRAVSHEVKGHAQATMSAMDGLTEAIDEIKARLKDGDGQMLSLASADHAIELKIVNRFELIKDWMRESFAGKNDLAAHEQSMTGKVNQLDNHVRDIERSVAVIKDRQEHPKKAV